MLIVPKFRRVLAVLMLPITCVGLFSSCVFDQFGKKERDERFGSVGQNPHQDMRFRAFIGRLRMAANSRDYEALRSMMTSNFGFDLGSQYEGPLNAFAYWDQYDLWYDLEQILAQEFALKGYFLVSPRQFADDETEYTGFRAGITDTRNGYRFAYFVDNNSRPFQPRGVNDPGQPGQAQAMPTQPQPGATGGNPRVMTVPGNNPSRPPSNVQPSPFTDAQTLEP